MNKQFKSLILFPTIFIVVLLGVLTAKNSYVGYFIFLLISFEQIYNWNKSIQSNSRKDYRIFFAEQHLNVIYLRMNWYFIQDSTRYYPDTKNFLILKYYPTAFNVAPTCYV